MTPTTYLVALGSNRCGRYGRPRAEVAAALAALPGIRSASPIVTSAAMGPSGRCFANAVALIDSDQPPPALLALLKQVERRFGRRRGRRWGARVLDLDIILWSGGLWRSPGLTIPHIAFRTRRFVLDPLLRIAPARRDPATGLTVRQLHARLTRARPVNRRRGAGAGP